MEIDGSAGLFAVLAPTTTIARARKYLGGPYNGALADIQDDGGIQGRGPRFATLSSRASQNNCCRQGQVDQIGACLGRTSRGNRRRRSIYRHRLHHCGDETNLAIREQLANNLASTRDYNALLTANQAIIGMIAIAKTLQAPDYSATLGYVIASRYAQALFEPTTRDLIVQDLLERAESHRRWMASEFGAAKAGPLPPQLPQLHSLTEQHLAIVQDKLNDFVYTDYKPLTDQYLQSYSSALLAIDNRDSNAPQIVQQHTDAFRDETQRLNAWAWNAAQILIDHDLDQLAASLRSKIDPMIGERCADIVEHTIEGHTKEFISAVAACRKAKLDDIERESIQAPS
jgi:hypothetical protein